jgi:predicted CopG family antitoxin
MEKKTIKINPGTHERLVSIGGKGETFDDIFNRLMDTNKKIIRRVIR